MTGEIWKDHPEKSLGMRADWVDKNPKAAHGRADGRAWRPSNGATRWRTRTSSPTSSASASGSTCPPADIINRIKGNIDYGDGRKVNGSDQLDEVLARRRLLSVPEP